MISLILKESKTKAVLRLGALALTLFPVLASITVPAEGVSEYKTGFYLRLRNEEFVQMMIPRERFLLDQARSVFEEIKERNAEGVKGPDLGIDRVMTPKETIYGQFIRELDRIVELSHEVSRLERMARLRSDMQALESLARLKTQIQNLLGRDPFTAERQTNAVSVPSTDTLIFAPGGTDLFEEWKYNQLLNYKSEQTLYHYLRIRLLNTASSSQEKRMFQRDLKIALERYVAGEYAVARLGFRDILEQYGRGRVLDDVLFYLAECAYGLNYLDEALESYNRLLALYPESAYRVKALTKASYIHYLYKQDERLFARYQELLSLVPTLESETFGSISYLV
ncbi:MAG TPA: hypothetical protein VGB38_06870, partial [bacterium]